MDLKSNFIKNDYKKNEVPFIADKKSFNEFDDINNIKSLLNKNVIGEFGINDLEKELIAKTLLKFNNNRRKTAKILGLSERTLYRKINQYNIEKNNENEL